MLRIATLARSSLALVTLFVACGDVADDSDFVLDAQHEAQVLRGEAPLENLASGRREILVGNIPAAENQLFLSDGRLLVSGDKGLYALVREGSSVTAKNLVPSAPCAFGGIAEARGVVYANCYEPTRAFLYAAKLDTLAFASIGEIKGVALANSLTSDGTHLYVSATMQSKIVRLTIDPSDPLTISAQGVFLSGADASLPNGTKVFQGALYWTDLMSIKSAPLSGKPIRTLSTQLTFFDDLYVDARGLIVADYLGNLLRAYDPSGKKLAQTKAVFQAPSSVQPARGRLGLGPDDLVVTERGGSVVSVYRVGR